jgi:phenylalanyl-tRNA synthetase beta chain
MKISIAWVFDHIDTSSIRGDWQSIDISNLIARFNQTTAEIEHMQKISVNLDTLNLAQIETISDDSCLVRNETDTKITLPVRNGLEIGQWYLIKQTDSGASWATMQDVGGNRDTLMPALMIQKSTVHNWKKQFEHIDYIIDVDNKSITHRPDMWGHRGFAREIAALLQLPLKPFGTFLASAEIESYDSESPVHDTSKPWSLAIEKGTKCSRFAAQPINSITYQPSLLWMAHRLARVDARAIDAIVDTTNYVMLDIGQPMHAFDADRLADKRLVVRPAQEGEQLHLLDGQNIKLKQQDIIVSDGEKPVALAGIMGGSHSSVHITTKSIVLEAACFDAVTIRHSAERHKIRTEASARFEKSLDPNQNTYAIRRFLALLKGIVLPQEITEPIISLGRLESPKNIDVSHTFIEQRLGVSLQPAFVVDILTRLDFEVEETDGTYRVSIPTFRATKDIGIKEDIVEEVGRYFGYSQIPYELPKIQSKPSDLTSTMRLRTIKQFFAYGCSMRELYNYALYDESFLRTINWQPGKTLTVTDPVSENWQRLVTSLLPHLFKAIAQNSAEHDQLRFFEFGRIWDIAQTEPEQKKLAGIMFEKKNKIDFYNAKTNLEQLFNMLRLPITWQKVDTPDKPWFTPYQTALLMHNGSKVGVAGKVNPAFLNSITEGDAFIFELDGDFLLHGITQAQRYQPVSKYPDVPRDISVFMPLTAQVDTILASLKNLDERIASVDLIDFFEKAEWHDKKALAFHIIMRDHHKTMTKEDVDIIWNKIVHALEQQGASIR